MSARAERSPGGAIRLLALDELTPELQARFAPRVERLGYLGGFFRVAAHQPAALEAFVDFTEAGKEALAHEFVELVALTCATAMGNDYERTQHERLAVSLGLSREWVAEVERLDPGQASLTPLERVVQRYVLAALADHGRGAGPALRELVDAAGEPDAVAVMLVCGRYVAHALLVNSCEIPAPVPSIFEEAVT